MTSRSRRFTFTINNPTPEEEASFKEMVEDSVYGICGYESASTTGTKHIQGYVHFDRAVYFSVLKARFPRAHIEVARGTDEQNRVYCTKEENFVEHGKPVKKGQRSDLTAFMDGVKEGYDRRLLIELHPMVFARYDRFATEYMDSHAQRNALQSMEGFKPRPWQKELIEFLEQKPDPRIIFWYYDFQGAQGKTYLSRYLVHKYGAFYTNGGKAADIAYAYQGEPIVIFDYVRDNEGYVCWGVIEALKNGIITSSKYHSRTKVYDIPHVVVFANFRPSTGKFSRDRIVMVTLTSTFPDTQIDYICPHAPPLSKESNCFAISQSSVEKSLASSEVSLLQTI